MTHRERVLMALRHREPDRVPMDLGGCGPTSIIVEAHQKLCEHLGIPLEGAPPLFDIRSDAVFPDERLQSKLGVDARALTLGAPDKRGDRVLSENAFLDMWGVQWERTGRHFIPTKGPLQGESEPGEASLRRCLWPDPADPGRYRGLRDRAMALHEGTDCAVIFSAGLGPVHIGQWMRGYAEWLLDLHANRNFLLGLCERVTEYWIATTTRALEEAGAFIDIVMFADDVGTQDTPLMRPSMHRELILPFHRRMAQTAKRFGKPVLYHSCGSVQSLIPAFLDAGIDALNPVQVSARHMEPARLKREFGRDLAFWGAIDTQHVLPFGSPDQVREEVRRRIDELSAAGGYIVSAVHSIQPDVPAENIAAMYKEALEYGKR